MSEHEISSTHLEFRKKNKNNRYIDYVILSKTEALYQKWLSDKNNELLTCTLTYILDEQEMIPDDIQFLGYLDDLAIIDGAEFLLSE